MSNSSYRKVTRALRDCGFSPGLDVSTADAGDMELVQVVASLARDPGVHVFEFEPLKLWVLVDTTGSVPWFQRFADESGANAAAGGLVDDLERRGVQFVKETRQ